MIADGGSMDSHVTMHNDVNDEVGNTAWLYVTVKLEVGIALVIAEVSGTYRRVGSHDNRLKQAAADKSVIDLRRS
jgi:hypothetical protein